MFVELPNYFVLESVSNCAECRIIADDRDTVLDKELHQMSKEEVGEENRELDALVESYKIRVGNDIGKASLSLTEEQIGKVLSHNYIKYKIMIKCSRPSGD